MTTKQDAIKLALEALEASNKELAKLADAEYRAFLTYVHIAVQMERNKEAIAKLSAISEAAQPVQDEDAFLKENRRLRERLAYTYSGALLYCDDGELQDNRCVPFIDFSNDTIDDIEAKMRDRSIRQLAQPSDKTFKPDWVNYHQGVSDGWLNAADWLNDNYQDHITVADVVSQMREEARAWEQPPSQAAAPAQSMPEVWRPISTAPKDGTYVLVSNGAGTWVAKYKPVFQSGFRPDNAWQSMMLNHDHIKREDLSYVPALWMPLPAPQPKQEQSGTDTQARDDKMRKINDHAEWMKDSPNE